MEKGKGHEAQIASVLSGLVTKGTITQAQADAVIAALEADRAAMDADRPLAKDRAAIDALVASTLGIDSATIKSRLKAGETLAAIAGSKKAALIDALVAEESKRIDAAVTAGKLTADQATARKSGLVAHVTTEVESVRPKGDKGPKGPKGGHGQHGGPMGAVPSVPSTGAAA
jgi:polyhydroxyalkanoate synthesis regulator phasin